VITNTYASVLLSIMKKNCSITKHMYHTFQQNYVEYNKMFYNKYICKWSERMYLLIKRETGNKNCNTYERSFMCYGTHTESNEISITSFSITCYTEQYWDCLPYCRTLQLCKYSSCYIRSQSSLYTHSPSYDGRQCGDSRYCILWWILFGAFEVNTLYCSWTHCSSLSTFCPRLLGCWRFCVHLVYTYIYMSLVTGIT